MTGKIQLICVVTTLLGIGTLASPLAAQSNPVTCLAQATSSSGLDLDVEDAIELCRGATAPLAPINCFVQAVWDEGINYDLALQLCRQASQARKPVDCYLEALRLQELSLADSDAVSLCSAD